MSYRGYGDTFPDDVDIDELIVDGSELLRLPGFWAAHYLNQTVEDEDLAGEVWGLDRATVAAAQQRLNAVGSWPAFEVELGGDAKLVVVYRNYEEDAGVDYLLLPDEKADAIRIATLEGNYQGPGISWAELTSVAGRFADPVRRAEVLLLLAPMLGDVEAESPGAIGTVTEALQAVGAVGDAEELARLIVSENLQWDPATWSVADSGALCCDDDSSPRNPDGPVALDESDLLAITSALTPQP